jgi:glycosyltransferase involved in cell wall biosynthesis
VKTVVVFTHAYPFSLAGETAFLQPEINALKNEFDRVVIVPRLEAAGASVSVSGVEVDLSLSRCLRLQPLSLMQKGTAAAGTTSFYREVIDSWAHTRHPRGLARAFAFTSMARATASWAASFLAKQPRTPPSLFYTYWMNFITEALADLRRRRSLAVPVATRAHGWDLYEERRRPPYIPYRARTVAGVDKLCVISEDGLRYLSTKYPRATDKLELHRLGVPDTGVISRASDDGRWRVLSCSFAVPVKRLGLLLDALIALARRTPDRDIEWSHLGGGPGLDGLRARSAQIPPNLKTIFTGTLTTDQIVAFYATHQVDLFANVSESEGIPVSVMECQRSGVPALATDVGGTREIIDESVGRLIPVTLTAEQIATAIGELLSDPRTRDQKRHASVANWRRAFCAEVNCQRFAHTLARMC